MRIALTAAAGDDLITIDTVEGCGSS